MIEIRTPPDEHHVPMPLAPSVVFSGGRAFPPQLPQRLVLCVPRDVPDAGRHYRADEGGVYRGGLAFRRAYKVAKARVRADIYQTARASIALPIPLDAPAIAMFRMVLAQAPSLIWQRDTIEDMADVMLAQRADYQQLRKIPGFGPINALSIIAEAGDARRFGHHRQFLKFCGLDLSTHQSGTFRGRTNLSKYGNARLRRTL